MIHVHVVRIMSLLAYLIGGDLKITMVGLLGAELMAFRDEWKR